MVDVDSWKIPLSCPKCGTKNNVTLGQIKKCETIQCRNCHTKINLSDKDASVKKGTKKVQDAMDSLEEAVAKLGGSIQVKT